MDVLLEARNLTKNFGSLHAVDDISLSVKKGEVLGFLGPNGAGKTTTMKMITGFLSPTLGETYVCGQPVSTNSVAARAHMGYLPEGAPLYGDMTPRGFLKFMASVRGIKGTHGVDVVESAARAVHLDNVMEQRIDTLSKGFRRRVGLAAAILHAPDVLILDEPTDGLDPNQKYEVRRLIEAMSVDRAIIISTHILEEVDAICHRAIIINEGRIVADGTPSELKGRSVYKNAVTLLMPVKYAQNAAGVLKGVKTIDRIEVAAEGAHVRLTALAKGCIDISQDITEILADKGWPVTEFTVDNGRLDDVFRSLTVGEI